MKKKNPYNFIEEKINSFTKRKLIEENCISFQIEGNTNGKSISFSFIIFNTQKKVLVNEKLELPVTYEDIFEENPFVTSEKDPTASVEFGGPTNPKKTIYFVENKSKYLADILKKFSSDYNIMKREYYDKEGKRFISVGMYHKKLIGKIFANSFYKDEKKIVDEKVETFYRVSKQEGDEKEFINFEFQKNYTSVFFLLANNGEFYFTKLLIAFSIGYVRNEFFSYLRSIGEKKESGYYFKLLKMAKLYVEAKFGFNSEKMVNLLECLTDSEKLYLETI